MLLQCSSLYCRVGLESGQCCCNAAACTAGLELRVNGGVAMLQLYCRFGPKSGQCGCNAAACFAGLDLRVASGVAM